MQTIHCDDTGTPLATVAAVAPYLTLTLDSEYMGHEIESVYLTPEEARRLADALVEIANAG